MFGYIRPDAPELRIKEFERFRACYCGLCHELGRRYGVAARLILNYDFVFLAMLLWHEDERSEYCFRRCIPSLCRKRCVSQSSRPLSICAAMSVILTYWKLCDTVNDERGADALAARMMRRGLTKAYRKASDELPDFDENVRVFLTELSEIEKAREASLDRPADKFALLLSSAAQCEPDVGTRRVLEQILYHVGRIIYIADAYHDLKDDLSSGNYNPVVERFGLNSPEVSKDVSEHVLGTMMSSQAMAAAAYELLPHSYWTPITENIIYFGIPDMCRRVMDGTYRPSPWRVPKRPKMILAERRTDNERPL